MENNKNQINLEKFLYVIKRRLVWIVLIAVLAGVAAGVATKLLVKPEYVSYATYYVQTSEQQQDKTQQQIAAAKSLVDTYIVFFRGNDFLEEVAKEAGVDYTYIQIRARMSASAVNGTEVFKVSISDTSAKTSYMISEVLANKAPAMIEKVSGGKVSVIDKPKMPTEPNSTGTKRNAVLAASLAGVIALAAFFIKELLDVTIYTEEDITDSFDYPVIGTIPTITSPSAEGKRKGQKGPYYGSSGEEKEENKEDNK